MYNQMEATFLYSWVLSVLNICIYIKKKIIRSVGMFGYELVCMGMVLYIRIFGTNMSRHVGIYIFAFF